MNVQRNLVRQEFTTFALAVQTNATPLNSNMGLTTMVDSIVISVPTTAANSIFFGSDAGVVTTTGLEIVPGVPIQLIIEHDGRQLYEIQAPLLDMAVAITCRSMIPETIPFVVWDVSQIYLVATAITNVVIGVFKVMFL